MSAWKPLLQLTETDALAWAALAGDDPTLNPAFMQAMQDSGSAMPDTGWQALHLMREDHSALLPLYAKSHSYGEYVFDHAWAEAMHRAGRRYYPKLVSAVPFTPASGQRLLTQGPLTPALAGEALAAVRALAGQIKASSWHLLFPRDDEVSAWQDSGLMHRLGCQYHWFDRNYGDFDGFLGHFRQSRRKTVRRERRLVAEQGVQLQTLDGSQLEPHHWEVFCRCYRATYEKRSGHAGYLNEAFFQAIARTMPQQLVMTLATHRGEYVAAALCLRSADTLYGRYWGALGEFANLHFEACYYQGIEYCLAHGLRRFDPGAQGEHKIPRGFEPVLTHSMHWLADPGLARAVAHFLDEERDYLRDYAVQARELLPFHRTPD